MGKCTIVPSPESCQSGVGSDEMGVQMEDMIELNEMLQD